MLANNPIAASWLMGTLFIFYAFGGVRRSWMELEGKESEKGVG
jgi:hypothetical protein